MRQGYTFIELLVTVALLAILSSFLIPTYQLLLAQAQLNTAVNQVADFIRLTEQDSITQQKIFGITLAVNATSVPQYTYDPNTATNTPTAASPLNLPSSINISAVNFSGASDVHFATSGAPNVSGDFVLTDTTRSRNRRVLIRPSGAIFTDQPEF